MFFFCFVFFNLIQSFKDLLLLDVNILLSQSLFTLTPVSMAKKLLSELAFFSKCLG